MNTDTVRRAGIPDLDQLVPLFDSYRQFYSMPSDPALARRFLADRISRNESVVLMAESSERAAVGFVQFYPSFSSVRVARTYILNDLFVAPDARRGGIASMLLKAAAEFARA